MLMPQVNCLVPVAMCTLLVARPRCMLAVFCAFLLWAPTCLTQRVTTVDLDSAHCGKKFRIATHFAPPFIMVDISKCENQKCGPEAFGDNGGVVYNLMMEHILPQLRTYCQESGFSELVDFEWYVPGSSTDFSSAEKAVQMVCRGGFHTSILEPLSTQNPICESGKQYKGPSPADEIARSLGLPTCSGAYEESGNAGCVSSGPDLVVGAVHVTGRHLDMLDFSVPYMAVEQLLVKRAKDESILTLLRERMDQVFTIFIPFTLSAWVAILLEILAMIFILLCIEAAIFIWLCQCCLHFQINEMVAPGFHGIVDCWYWAFSMTFNCGASGKYPITSGGKIYIVGHCLFVTIIAASYTGSMGPAIMSTDRGVVKSFDTLKSGISSVAVVGPRWDPDDDPPKYLGNYRGTSIPHPSIIVPESIQFKMLQSEMKVNSAATFSIVAGQTMYSKDTLGQPFLHTKEQDPCDSKNLEAGVQLGIYDMVRCKSIDGKTVPHSTMYDAPQVVYELMQRYNNTGKCELVARGARFGSSSYGIGFPKNTSLPHIFSRATERVKFKGIIDKLLKEAQLFDNDNKCAETYEELSLTVAILSGLFLLVFSLIIFSLLSSGVVRSLDLPISTLSDKQIRRSAEKDAERDWIDAHKQHKVVSSGRSARMKGHKMTGHSEHDRETPAQREARRKEEAAYKPTFHRKQQGMGDLAPTKQLLTQIHQFCEHFEDQILTIERNAGNAQRKAQEAAAERQTVPAAASSHMSRTGARNTRESSEPAAPSSDVVTLSSKVTAVTCRSGATGQSNTTDSAIAFASSPELVFADFTSSFPRKK